MHIYLTSEKRDDTIYLTRIIKDDRGNVVYQATYRGDSAAFENDIVRDLENYLTEYSPKESECGCDRCCNSCNFRDSRRKPGLFSKLFKLISKLFKVRS